MKYINAQKYSCCQLVVAINAAIHLGGKPIEINSEEYERLVDLVMCREGSAIAIKKAYEYLRLDYDDGKPDIKFIDKMLKVGRPVAIGVNSKETGMHEVLVVDYKNGKVMIPNFSKVTDNDMWIEWDIIKDKYLDVRKNIETLCGKFRAFKIKKYS